MRCVLSDLPGRIWFKSLWEIKSLQDTINNSTKLEALQRLEVVFLPRLALKSAMRLQPPFQVDEIAWESVDGFFGKQLSAFERSVKSKTFRDFHVVREVNRQGAAGFDSFLLTFTRDDEATSA